MSLLSYYHHRQPAVLVDSLWKADDFKTGTLLRSTRVCHRFTNISDCVLVRRVLSDRNRRDNCKKKYKLVYIVYIVIWIGNIGTSAHELIQKYIKVTRQQRSVIGTNISNEIHLHFQIRFYVPGYLILKKICLVCNLFDYSNAVMLGCDAIFVVFLSSRFYNFHIKPCVKLRILKRVTFNFESFESVACFNKDYAVDRY